MYLRAISDYDDFIIIAKYYDNTTFRKNRDIEILSVLEYIHWQIWLHNKLIEWQVDCMELKNKCLSIKNLHFYKVPLYILNIFNWLNIRRDCWVVSDTKSKHLSIKHPQIVAACLYWSVSIPGLHPFEMLFDAVLMQIPSISSLMEYWISDWLCYNNIFENSYNENIQFRLY